MKLEGNEYDPKIVYELMLFCKKLGMTTEKGDWAIARVAELQAGGNADAVEIAIKEAGELWQGFDPNKKIPVV